MKSARTAFTKSSNLRGNSGAAFGFASDSPWYHSMPLMFPPAARKRRNMEPYRESPSRSFNAGDHWSIDVPPCAHGIRPTGIPVRRNISTLNESPNPAPFLRSVRNLSSLSPVQRSGSLFSFDRQCTRSAAFTSVCNGSSATSHLSAMSKLWTSGSGCCTSIRSPCPSMLDCPASSHRSPTRMLSTKNVEEPP